MKQSDYYELEVQSVIVDSIASQTYEIITLETTLLQPLSYDSIKNSSCKRIAYMTNDGNGTAGFQFQRNILNSKTIVSVKPGEMFTASLRSMSGGDYTASETILRWAFTFTLKPITL